MQPDEAVAKRIYAQTSGDSTLVNLIGSTAPVQLELEEDQTFPVVFFQCVRPGEWVNAANLGEVQFSSTWNVVAVDKQPPGAPSFGAVLDPAANRIHDLFHGVDFIANSIVTVGRCVRQVRRRASLSAGEKLVEAGWVIEFIGGRTA